MALTRTGPRCSRCGAFLSSESVRARLERCSPCRGVGSVPLDRDDLRELSEGLLVAVTLELDRSIFFACGHERAGNTYRDRDRSKLDAAGNPRVRERCLACRREREQRRDRRAAA